MEPKNVVSNSPDGGKRAIGEPNDQQINDLAGKLRKPWADAIAAVTKQAPEALDQFLDVYAPKIARQSLLMNSPDPQVAANAKTNLRHLRGQLLMEAGRNGVRLEQRMEQAFLATIDVAMKIV